MPPAEWFQSADISPQTENAFPLSLFYLFSVTSVPPWFVNPVSRFNATDATNAIDAIDA
jgi:hypothetical protein